MITEYKPEIEIDTTLDIIRNELFADDWESVEDNVWDLI